MELPMPQDAVDRVGAMGLRQKMPKTLTFADRFGFELPDAEDDVDDEHDSDYEPDDEDDSDDGFSMSYGTSTHSSDDDDNDDDDDDDNDDDDDDDDDDNDDGEEFAQPLPGLSAGVDVHGDDSKDDDHDDDDDKSPEDTGNRKMPIINIPDTAIKTEHNTSNCTDNSETPGVGTPGKSAGVGIDVETVEEDNDNAEEEREQLACEMDERYGARQHLINLSGTVNLARMNILMTATYTTTIKHC
jgi:hypothetical protein